MSTRSLQAALGFQQLYFAGGVDWRLSRAYRSRCHTNVRRSLMPTSSLPKPVLVFITPNGFCNDHKTATILARRALDGGATLIQLRDLKAGKEEILAVANMILSAGIPPCKLSINGLEPADVLAVSEELGVHVREADTSKYLKSAQRLMSSDSIISCSVHSVQSALHATSLASPSYLQVGTMFPTQSHPGKLPEGPTLLSEIRDKVGPSQPLVAIGGIKKHNIAAVFKHGADGVAVISAISSSDMPDKAASELLADCEQHWRGCQGS